MSMISSFSLKYAANSPECDSFQKVTCIQMNYFTAFGRFSIVQLRHACFLEQSGVATLSKAGLLHLPLYFLISMLLTHQVAPLAASCTPGVYR